MPYSFVLTFCRPIVVFATGPAESTKSSALTHWRLWAVIFSALRTRRAAIAFSECRLQKDAGAFTRLP